MKKPQLSAGGGTAPAAPTLLEVLRDAQLYRLLRALIANQISKLLTSDYFTYDLNGDEVLVDEDRMQLVVKAIGQAVGNPRLRVSQAQLRGLEGQITMVLSAPARQALLLEMAALLAHLSAQDLASLPPVDHEEGETS